MTRVCAAVIVMCSACAGRAMTPATLIRPNLQPEHVMLVGLSRGELSYFDTDRHLQTTTIASHFVQLGDIGEAPPGTATAPKRGRSASSAKRPDVAVLTLVDGQRWVGQWLGWSKDGQSVRWRPTFMGKRSVAVPLERIASIRIGGGKETPAQTAASGATDGLPASAVPTNDRVILANGDTVSGFVTRFANSSSSPFDNTSPTPCGTIQLQQDSGQTLPIPIENVLAIFLANPSRPTTTGDMLFLRDGSQVLASQLGIKDDQATFTLGELASAGGASVESEGMNGKDMAAKTDTPILKLTVSLDQLDHIDFIGAGWRLVPLADLAWSVRNGGEVFGLAYPPRIEGRDTSMKARAPVIHLHAPVTIAFSLPDHTVRFAAVAALNLGADVPVRRQILAGFKVMVRVEGAQRPRRLADSPAGMKNEGLSRTAFDINAAHPNAPINLAIPYGSTALLVQLDPGVNGPILDRLALRHAVVLVATSPSN